MRALSFFLWGIAGATFLVGCISIVEAPPLGNAVHQERNFIWPVEGTIISIFGMRRGGSLNKGIDIQAPEGIEVVASQEGNVRFVHESLPGFGKTVILDHGDQWATVYAYLGEILVQQGEWVTQRQVIGRVGRTGWTNVPAVHFEIRREQRPQNPFYYLP